MGDEQHDQKDQADGRECDDQEVVVGALPNVFVGSSGSCQIDMGAGEDGAFDGVPGGVLDRVDAGDALRCGGVTGMGDDQLGGLAVGGEEQIEAALKLGIVEGFRWQIERVVHLRRVVGLAECGRVVTVGQRLGVHPRVGRIVGQGQVEVLFLIGDLRR